MLCYIKDIVLHIYIRENQKSKNICWYSSMVVKLTFKTKRLELSTVDVSFLLELHK